MPDKLKQYFGILVLVAAGGIGFFAVKEYKDQQFQSESLEKASERVATNVEQDIKVAKSKATKEKPAMLHLVEKQRKDLTSKLNAASTEKKKLNVAANTFMGAYFLNARNRPDYCTSLGIPINSFVRLYKQEHHQLFTIAEKIQIQDHAEHGYTYDIDRLYKLMSSSGDKIIVQDMKDAASAVKMSEKELCQSFEQDSIEWVNIVDFRKRVPEVANILLSYRG
jgi:hypothetical protein